MRSCPDTDIDPNEVTAHLHVLTKALNVIVVVFEPKSDLFFRFRFC